MALLSQVAVTLVPRNTFCHNYWLQEELLVERGYIYFEWKWTTVSLIIHLECRWHWIKRTLQGLQEPRLWDFILQSGWLRRDFCYNRSELVYRAVNTSGVNMLHLPTWFSQGRIKNISLSEPQDNSFSIIFGVSVKRLSYSESPRSLLPKLTDTILATQQNMHSWLDYMAKQCNLKI